MKNQSGRSMIEMLGVLAIIALLSVIGVAAYRYAVSRHEANSILKQSHEIASDVMFRQQMFSARENGAELIFQGSDKTELRAFREDSRVFRVVTPALDKDVCSAILRLGPDYPMLLPQTFEEEGNCAETEDGFVANLYFSILGNRRYAGNNGGGGDVPVVDPEDCREPALSHACQYLVNTGNVDANDCPIYQIGEHIPREECTTETGKAGTYDENCKCIPNYCEDKELQNTVCVKYEKTGDFDENGCPEYSKSCYEGTSCKLSDGTDGVCSKETCECVETTESEDGTEDIIGGNSCPDEKPYSDDKGNCYECTNATHCLSFCSDNTPYYFDVEREIYTTILNEKLNEEGDINLVYRGAYLTTEGDIKYDIPFGDEDDPYSGLYSMGALGVCHYTCVQNKCEEYLPACDLANPGRGTYGIGCDNVLCFWETPIVLKGVDETWGYCPDNTTSEMCILSIKDCIPCGDNEYSSPKNGIVECQPCPVSSVLGVRTDLNSVFSGTDADDYCVCPENTYWNYTEEKCMSCPENAVVSENPAYRIYGWNVCGCASNSVVIKSGDNIIGCCPAGQYWKGTACADASCPGEATLYNASAPTGDTFDVPVSETDTSLGSMTCMCPSTAPIYYDDQCQACSSGVYVFGSGCVADYCDNPGEYATNEASCQKWGEVCDKENGSVYVDDSCYLKTSYCDQPGQYATDVDSCQKWGEVCIEDSFGATYIGSACVGTSYMCDNFSTYATDPDSCSVWSNACKQPMYWNERCIDASSFCEMANSITTDYDCENLNTTYNCNVVWFKASESGYCYPFNNICPEEIKGNVVSDETSCLAWGSACGYSVTWGDECTVTVEASDDGSAV